MRLNIAIGQPQPRSLVVQLVHIERG